MSSPGMRLQLAALISLSSTAQRWRLEKLIREDRNIDLKCMLKLSESNPVPLVSFVNFQTGNQDCV